MLKYLTKLAMEIFPSVLATIIGAYIVNHYISAKPAADAPTAAVSSTTPGKTDGGKADTAKADPKSDSKADPKAGSTELASLPEPGIKAKGISEKAVKTTSDGPKGASESLYEKLVDKPAESVTVPADTRRGPAVSRDKSDKPVAKSTAPAPAAPAVVTATAPAEVAATPEERRDATDLARAAIERLRNSGAATQGTSGSQNTHVQEAVRAPEPRGAEPRPDAVAPISETPRAVAAPPMRPLPPPITVIGPGADTSIAAAPPGNPPYTGAVRSDDPARPTPPAEIPPPPPLDLHAGDLSPRDQATKVAEDMLTAAKSVFHAVLPKHRDRD